METGKLAFFSQSLHGKLECSTGPGKSVYWSRGHSLPFFLRLLPVHGIIISGILTSFSSQKVGLLVSSVQLLSHVRLFATPWIVACQASLWISYRYTHIPLPFEPLSHLPPHSTPLGWYRALFEFPEPYSKCPLAIYFTHANVSFQVALSMPLTLSFPSLFHKSALFACFSIAALQLNSLVPSF